MKHAFKILFLLLFLIILTNFIFTQEVALQYKCFHKDNITNQIKPHFKIINRTNIDINLNDLKIRYYFTLEDPETQQFNVDWAAIGNIYVNGIFKCIDNNEYYVEVKFDENSGILNPGKDTGDIQIRFNKINWTNYNQTDDYSFDENISDYIDYTSACLYYKDEYLIWGQTPSGDIGDPSLIENNNNNNNNNGDDEDEEPIAVQDDDWLHTVGTNIVDKDGNIIRITGINYFGFETINMCFQGLWASDLITNLDLIADLGFNLIRVPLSVELVSKWRDGEYPMPGSGSVNTWQMNEYLIGKNSLEIFDYALDYCKKLGLKVMLDMHEVLKDRKRNMWYYQGYTPEDFYTCWEWLAERYKDNDTIIAIDLFNEPHGKVYINDYSSEGEPAIWNNSDLPNNFKKTAETAAARILAINPNLLIMVEGIHSFPKDPINNNYILTSYNDKEFYWENWWGGNLRGAAYYPVNLGQYQSQLVYEPHDYGPRVWPDHPWFREGFDDIILFNECWQPNWFYIYENGMAPLLIGEWGCKMDMETDIKWFLYFADFIKTHNLNYTYWCFNPNSHDTGGIIKEDYVTLESEKYEIIKPTIWMDENDRGIGLDHIISLGEDGTNITEYYNLGN